MFEIATFVVYAASLVVGLVVVLKRRPELSTFAQTSLWVGEVVVLAASYVLFGWWGLLLAAVVLVIAFVVSSVRLYAEWERVLVAAISRGRLNMTKSEVKAFARHLRTSDRALRGINLIGVANLVRILSESGRDADDIETMAPTLARVWVIYDCRDDPAAQERVTRKFDRCLRLWRKDTSEAESVADTLVTATKNTPSRFEEMLDAMIALADPFTDDNNDAAA